MNDVNKITLTVEEPTEWGSLVRARRSPGAPLTLLTYVPEPDEVRDSRYSWYSDQDSWHVWSDLSDVEVLRVGVGEPAAEAVEADEAPHVPCPDCNNDPKDPDQHADGCRRIGQPVEIQCGPPWLPFPEPTPEQVEAASAPEWARLDASNAESDAIDALVEVLVRFDNDWPGVDGDDIHYFRALAARVLEVRGQQLGVPVFDRERVEASITEAIEDLSISAFPVPYAIDGKRSASLPIETVVGHIAGFIRVALLPKEPTS